MGRIFGIQSYWAAGQWGIADLTVGSTVGKHYIIYDVFPPMACLIGELGGCRHTETISFCLHQLFCPQRFVMIELVVDYRLVTTKGYENQ